MIAQTSAIPDNSCPVIESCDVIARIEQLESWISDLSVELNWREESEKRQQYEDMQDELEGLVLLDNEIHGASADWRHTKLYRYDNPARFDTENPFEVYFEDVPYYFA